MANKIYNTINNSNKINEDKNERRHQNIIIANQNILNIWYKH